MTKKNSEIINLEPGASPETNFGSLGTSIVIDNELVESIKKEINEKKETIRSKVYAISFSDTLLKAYEDFMTNEAEWISTEALGIREINKQIQKIKKEGVKNDVIFMGPLPLEASHYFISKGRGKGSKSAEEFLSLYKPFDQALSDAKKDAVEIKELETKLAAAMQGLSLG